MASFKQGILGGFSGKIGGVIGTSWKGINVMKSMPASVANPRTAAQVGNRTRFSAIGNLAMLLGVTFMNNYWARFAVKMTGFNLFTSTNKAVFSTSGTFSPTTLKACDGSINAVASPSITCSHLTGYVIASWTGTATGEQLLTDEIQLVVMSPSGAAVALSQVVSLEDATVQLTWSGSHNAGLHLHAYLVGRRADGTKTYIQTYVDVTIS
jgi:hypothetical protein